MSATFAQRMRSSPRGAARLGGSLFLLALVAQTPAALRAQGFGVYEQSTCAMGQGTAVVAMPCNDGSAVFFNPAAIGDHRGLTISGGATGILAIGHFQADLTGAVTDMTRKLVPVPHAYVTYGFGDRFGVGVGFNTPWGLATEWPQTSDAAFLGYKQTLRSFYLQPAASARLTDAISVGAGLTIVLSNVELNQVLDLSTQLVPTTPGLPAGTTFGQLGIPFHTPFAAVHLKSSTATGVGANFGLRARLTDRVSFGARYLTRVKLDYTGTATFDPMSTGIILPAGNPFGVPAGTPLDAVLQGAGLFQGPLATQGVKTSVTMPDQLVLGIGVQATDRLRLEGDYYWTHWALFDSLPVDFQGGAGTETRLEEYGNTSGFRLGGQLDLPSGWRARLGYVYNEPAAPDQTVTPLLPEGKRSQFAGGVGWHVSPQLDLDLAYSYLLQVDRRGRVQDPLPGQPPTTALNSGLYGFKGHLMAATVTLHF